MSVLRWEGVSMEVPWSYSGLLLLRAHKGIKEVAWKYLFFLTWNPPPSAFVCEGERISAALSPYMKPRHKRRYDNIKIYLALKLQHAELSTCSQTPCHVSIINVILASPLQWRLWYVRFLCFSSVETWSGEQEPDLVGKLSGWFIITCEMLLLFLLHHPAQQTRHFCFFSISRSIQTHVIDTDVNVASLIFFFFGFHGLSLPAEDINSDSVAPSGSTKAAHLCVCWSLWLWPAVACWLRRGGAVASLESKWSYGSWMLAPGFGYGGNVPPVHR